LEYLEDLRTRLREAGTGVEIKDRQKGTKTYKKCFLADELVAWLSKNEQLTAVSATILGQELESNGIINNAFDDKRFENKSMLFRFQVCFILAYCPFGTIDLWCNRLMRRVKYSTIRKYGKISLGMQC